VNQAESGHGAVMQDTLGTMSLQSHRTSRWQLLGRALKAEAASSTIVSRNVALTTTTPIVRELTSASRRAIASSPVVAPSMPNSRVTGMQKWDARVVDVDGDVVVLELQPPDSGPRLLADFSMELFGDDEARVGDLAYVTVRTVRGAHGYPHRTSAVRLRRVGKWNEGDAATIDARAKDAKEKLEQFFD